MTACLQFGPLPETITAMNDRPVPRLSKWPFLIADVALLGVATWLFYHYPHPLAAWAGGLITACVVAAGLLAVWPFRLEYQTAVNVFESDRLVNAAEAIRNLEEVGTQIQQATAQWQGVQEHAGRTTQAAREIAERMTAEARAFSEFMTKANDTERSTLRLEVEKLRRGEGQWLQVLVHTLDHVHALYQAGTRSGQANLATQLATFQAACRDLARRVGLTAVDAEVDQAFDSAQHEVIQGQEQPVGATRIAQIIAPGYSFQGQVLRRPIVVVKSEETTPDTETITTPAEDGPIGEAVETVSASSGDPALELAELSESNSTEEEFVTTTQAHEELLAEPGVPAVESGAPDEPIAAEPEPEPGPGSETVMELESAAEPTPANLEEFRLESDSVGQRERRRAGNG
jgi:molecular chaperone GrpE (heat shock protein)